MQMHGHDGSLRNFAPLIPDQSNCTPAPRGLIFMLMDDRKWYALHVRPNYEQSVASRLKELGVEEYLPVQRRQKVPQRNKFNEGLPLFPGYVFSHLQLNSGPRLYSIPGILRILGHGGYPVAIEDDEMTTIRAIADSQLRIEVTSYFQPGEKICLVAGPLAGVSGTFLHTAKGNKLAVCLPLLKRSLTVTVMPEWVASDTAMLA